MPVTLRKLITGGQTGVDRGALDAAMEHGFPCGGWCPEGRMAEDGPLPDCYPLQDTACKTLNVAGPRASEWPQGYGSARAFVAGLLDQQGSQANHRHDRKPL